MILQRLRTLNLRQVFLGISLAGIALAIYHAYGEITYFEGPGSKSCSITASLSCVKVFAYSHPFGIPLYPFGLVWFPLVFLVALYMKNGINGIAMISLLMVGNMFTVYLWFLDIMIVWPAVHAVCPVCLSMYFVNYCLTALAVKAA